MISELVKRVTGDVNLYDLAIRRSFLVSADMAHAVHPNVRFYFDDCVLISVSMLKNMKEITDRKCMEELL